MPARARAEPKGSGRGRPTRRGFSASLPASAVALALSAACSTHPAVTALNPPPRSPVEVRVEGDGIVVRLRATDADVPNGVCIAVDVQVVGAPDRGSSVCLTAEDKPAILGTDISPIPERDSTYIWGATTGPVDHVRLQTSRTDVTSLGAAAVHDTGGRGRTIGIFVMLLNGPVSSLPLTMLAVASRTGRDVASAGFPSLSVTH